MVFKPYTDADRIPTKMGGLVYILRNGAGGAAFMFGDNVKGGQYSEFPSMKSEDLEQGDVVPNYDFRGLYTTVLEDWMGLDGKPIVDGSFEKLPIFA